MRKGFTLIELLVVISIIALLLSILVPSLQLAKQKAQTTSCLSNLRNIMLAWQMYTVDNDDKIVNGYCWSDYTLSQGGPGCWVEPPQDKNGVLDMTGDVPAEYRFNGIRKGLLYSYLNTIDVYHCPGDTRFKKGTSVGNSLKYKFYRTYSVADGAVANAAVGSSMKKRCGYQMPMKVTEIQRPSDKYVLIEESYDGGAGYNFNDASWNFDYNGQGTSPTGTSAKFWDPLGIFHNDSCTLSFADGHAEPYKFKDKRTIEYFTDRNAYTTAYGGPPDEKNNDDVKYFKERWPGIAANK